MVSLCVFSDIELTCWVWLHCNISGLFLFWIYRLLKRRGLQFRCFLFLWFFNEKNAQFQLNFSETACICTFLQSCVLFLFVVKHAANMLQTYSPKLCACKTLVCLLCAASPQLLPHPSLFITPPVSVNTLFVSVTFLSFLPFSSLPRPTWNMFHLYKHYKAKLKFVSEKLIMSPPLPL